MIGEQFVVDMQHHHIPAEALKFVGKTPEYDYSTTLTRFAEAYSVMTDIEADLGFMDEAGIDAAILSTGSFTPNGIKFCRACNSGYARVVKQYPKRFKGMIHVYPHDDARHNRDEIKRAVEELGLFGLALVSSYGDITLDSELMDPLYEAAIAYSMPIFVHPTIRTNLWGGNRYDMHTTISREYDLAKACIELLYGVLPKFPQLRVIMAHFGGGLPTLKGRLLAWYRPKHIPVPPESRTFGLAVEEAKELGLFDDFESRLENFLFDSAGFGGWLPVIRAGFETLGACHVCFGSDYPYELNKPQYTKKVLSEINRLDIPAADKRKFFGENVRDAFRI